MKLIHASLKEMRRAFRVFAQYRGMRKVSTFGSARTPAGSPQYEQAHEFARRMADAGFMVITGAGPGIMRACNEGSGRDRSFGINIRLPFEQAANDIIDKDPKLVTFKYFFTRKLMFVKECDAVCMLPGGFGTMDEAMEVLTLLQTGKRDLVPIVFLDEPGGTFWQGWQEFVEKQLLAGGMISPDDLALYKLTDQVDEAVAEIRKFYRNYHSMRYVRNKLVFRLQHQLTGAQLHHINVNFSEVLQEGEFTASGPLKEERDEPELADLSRLVFRFNRRDLGRLRMLVDYLNELVPADAPVPHPEPPKTPEL